MKKGIILFLALFLAITYSCEDFLETTPLGVNLENVYYSEKGINALLIGAYSLIDGDGSGGSWGASVTNWVWGSVASDDAYKGTDYSDQTPINSIERYECLTTNAYVRDKWRAHYDGIARCNDVLKIMGKTTEGLSETFITSIKAQALFLRGWYHFELKRVYKNIPYITEDVEDPTLVPNTADTWPMIEADLQFAVDNLPPTQADVGRATKYAAMAVLARVHLFQQDYSAAASLLDQIISSGNYTLMPNYHDNYNVHTNNNAESIFEIQYAVNDGSWGSVSAGWGDCLNFPQGNELMSTCCGFHQPSQNLVNAFKVDANGLPLLDNYNDIDLKKDQGILSKATFVPFTDFVDPRLDWTVGRRGIPYLDWWVMRGYDWIRDQENGGCYLPKKNMFYQADQGTLSTTTGWATGVNANNYRAYRYAHVLLWRAECYVESATPDLEAARQLVNQVRIRARDGNRVMGLCTSYELNPGVVPVVDYTQEAANYDVQPYLSFTSQEYARKAVHHELRLEFGMEGHRFFDLVRWGIAADVLNKFITRDIDFRIFLKGDIPAVFNADKDEYWPIPQSQIDQQIDADGNQVLTQNPNY